MAPSPETSARNCRRQAEACKQLAANSELDRKIWLRLTAEWLKLAEDAEKSSSEEGFVSKRRNRP